MIGFHWFKKYCIYYAVGVSLFFRPSTANPMMSGVMFFLHFLIHYIKFLCASIQITNFIYAFPVTRFLRHGELFFGEMSGHFGTFFWEKMSLALPLIDTTHILYLIWLLMNHSIHLKKRYIILLAILAKMSVQRSKNDRICEIWPEHEFLGQCLLRGSAGVFSWYFEIP